MVDIDKGYTITFDEKVNGWNSFFSFFPEWMIGVNNRMFSFNKGDLYIQDSDEVPRGEFYGEISDSELTVIFNDSPSDTKVFQTIEQEGSIPWDVALKSYVSSNEETHNSTIAKEEFSKKEGVYYAYARRDENPEQTYSGAVYGLGQVIAKNGNAITLYGQAISATSGDKVIQSTTEEVLGEILDYHIEGINSILTASDSASINVGDFLLGRKDSRVEGGHMRGYAMEVNMKVYSPARIELFAVNSEVKKSFR